MLADYIRTRNPKAKGWSYSTIYRMVRFYEMYSSDGFTQTVSRYGMQNYLSGTEQKKLPFKDGELVPIELAQRGKDKIVSIGLTQKGKDKIMPFEMAQIPDMEVVRYALNRSMSPTMVALYKEQLQVGGVIQRSLEEFCRFVNEGKQ